MNNFPSIDETEAKEQSEKPRGGTKENINSL